MIKTLHLGNNDLIFASRLSPHSRIKPTIKFPLASLLVDDRTRRRLVGPRRHCDLLTPTRAAGIRGDAKPFHSAPHERDNGPIAQRIFDGDDNVKDIARYPPRGCGTPKEVIVRVVKGQDDLGPVFKGALSDLSRARYIGPGRPLL